MHIKWLFAVLAAELAGTHALQVPEAAVEVGQVVEARVEGDVRNRTVGLDQLAAGQAGAQLVEVRDQGAAGLAPEEPAESRDAQVGRGGGLGQRDALRAAVVEEAAHAVDAARVAVLVGLDRVADEAAAAAVHDAGELDLGMVVPVEAEARVAAPAAEKRRGAAGGDALDAGLHGTNVSQAGHQRPERR